MSFATPAISRSATVRRFPGHLVPRLTPSEDGCQGMPLTQHETYVARRLLFSPLKVINGPSQRTI
jgi:hypothetical protein